jgi:hypothetical protein
VSVCAGHFCNRVEGGSWGAKKAGPVLREPARMVISDALRLEKSYGFSSQFGVFFVRTSRVGGDIGR